MSETTDHGAPGRSLLAEMTTLREEMKALRQAMGLLVDLQRDVHTKLDGALGGHPISGEGSGYPTSVPL
jgi:hypothetical protein